MKITVPEYFKNFKCIADRCRDSCCIGWEIDIDTVTLDKYARLEGDLGAEIREKTQHGCFPTLKNGRCAFLDDIGLCRIIKGLGEGYLCDICREHPRYYGIGKDGLDGGIGLSCPEAARIILSLDRLPNFETVDGSPAYQSEDEYAGDADKIREMIYAEIYTKDVKELFSVIHEIARYADELAFSLTSGLEASNLDAFSCEKASDTERLLADSLELFSDCEALTDEWGERLSQAKREATSQGLPDVIRKNEAAFRNLLFYFTHRYVRECIEDMTVGARVLFALYSSVLIFLLASTYDGDDYEKAAVLFSKNIEYSTSNTDDVIDKISLLL